MYNTSAGLKKDDYETACEIIVALNISTDDKEKILSVTELPDKYKGKISLEHVKTILLERIN